MAGQKMLCGRRLFLWKVMLSLKSLVSNMLGSISLTAKDFCVEPLQQYQINTLLTFLRKGEMKITYNEISVKSLEQSMFRKAQYYSEIPLQHTATKSGWRQEMIQTFLYSNEGRLEESNLKELVPDMDQIRCYDSKSWDFHFMCNLVIKRLVKTETEFLVL